MVAALKVPEGVVLARTVMQAARNFLCTFLSSSESVASLGGPPPRLTTLRLRLSYRLICFFLGSNRYLATCLKSSFPFPPSLYAYLFSTSG